MRGKSWADELRGLTPEMRRALLWLGEAWTLQGEARVTSGATRRDMSGCQVNYRTASALYERGLVDWISRGSRTEVRLWLTVKGRGAARRIDRMPAGLR